MRSISLEQFLNSPQSELLAYPSSSLGDDRIHELRTLGITAIYDYGPQCLGHWQCLGLGYFGAVFLVDWQGQLAALKVRRSDASRDSFTQESAMLRLANTRQIGPSCLAVSQNFLLMEYAQGLLLVDWLQPERLEIGQLQPEQLQQIKTKDVALPRLPLTMVESVVLRLLEQAFQLDQMGLDHGNLRCVTAHVVVHDDRPILLDFSTASTERRPANVTTLVQGLFWGTCLAPMFANCGLHCDRTSTIPKLRCYKQQPTRQNFQQLCQHIFGRDVFGHGADVAVGLERFSSSDR